MTATEKSKKKKKKSTKAKKNKAKNTKNKVEKAEAAEAKGTDVLESVMDSIEMAGASLDFFEGDSDTDKTQDTEVSLSDDVEGAESILSMDGEAETVEEVVDEAIEAASEATEASEGESAQALSEGESSEENSEDVDAESESPVIDEHTENLELIDGQNEEEFIDQTQAHSILESLLFSSDKPLGMGTFKAVFKGTNFKTKEIKSALNELMTVYAEASRGVTLEEVNGGWQLRTKVDNMDFLRKLAKARPFRLSGPALEVLAIIAYKQPLIKHEVDEIRGVESGHLVRALMEKHLVSFQGKSELPGKPMQYGTTRKFLEIFGLRNLKELPSLDEIDQLLPDGIGIEEDDVKLSDVTESMSESYDGNYSEGEEELLKIEGTLGGIDTSSEFFDEEKRRQKEKRDRDRARDIREALDVDEAVEPKDIKWLERYELKLVEEAAAKATAEAEAEAQAQEGAAVEIDGLEASELNPDDAMISETEKIDDLIAVPEEGLGDELSALSSESLISDDVMAEDEELEAQDVSEEVQAQGASEKVEAQDNSAELEEADTSVNDDSDSLDVTDEEIGKTFDPFEGED